MDLLMLLLFIGFCIISLSIVLHCTQHFRCRCCIKYTYRISSYTANSSGFNTRNKHNRRSTNNSITINTPHRRSTNTTPQHVRVSNSMNNIPTKQKWHHRTLSSLYENRFTASISSLRPSIHSFGGHDGPRFKRKCQFCLYGAEEDFDFFPSAFLLYLLFMICMIISLIIRCIILHNTPLFHIHNHVSHLYEDVFWVLLNTKLTASSFQQLTTLYTNTLYHMDWILAYCIMILSVWESLFNFYRYYTTMYAARYFYSIETKYVLRQFAYYLAAYCIVFIANIHLYYWLFPITILSHFVFNTYCTFEFAHILVVQYEHIISTDSFLTDVHDEMLSSVYLMRKFSMFSCILSSIYIAVLLISYNVDTVIYLPIVWSLCALSFTLNFVRNRQFILRQLYKIHHCLIVKNFSCVSCCCMLRDRMCHCTAHGGDKEAKNLKKSTTENGSIADLKRQRKHRNDHHPMHSDHKRTHLKLRNESTLSFTTPTPQICGPPGHTMKNVLNGTHRNLSTLSVASIATVETLPTLKERGLTIKPISMISEISGGIEEEGEEVSTMQREEEEDDEDDASATDINEEDHDCLGTPSSVDISKVSTNDSPIASLVENTSRIYEMNMNRPRNTNLHTISITAPDTNTFKRNHAFIPTPIRTRSATLNTSSSKSIIQVLNESGEDPDLTATPLQKTQSDNLIRKSISYTNKESAHFTPNNHKKHTYSQPGTNHRHYQHHNISPLVVKSCGHTPQSNSGGITLWNPPKQHEIPPIDLMLDIQYDAEDETQTQGANDELYESVSSDAIFHNDIHDDVHQMEVVPSTPSRKCKALMLLGISSNESSVVSNHTSGHSLSQKKKKKHSRRNILKHYGSYSSNKSKSTKVRSLRHKLSKSKSSVHNKRYNVPPHSNPLSQQQRVMTKSSSQHLSKQYRSKMQKMKSSNADDGGHRRNVTISRSNGHTPQSNISSVNNVSKHWYHEYIRSRQTQTQVHMKDASVCTAGEVCTNKSFSKTLTQSELRDIVYEENDIILMETIQQQQLADSHQTRDSIISCNTPQTQQHNPIQLIGSKVSTKSDYNYSIEPYIYTHNLDNTNGFASTSYHSENMMKSRRTNTNTNTMSLNKRIFELLEIDTHSSIEPAHLPHHHHHNNNQLQTSSLPPKIYDLCDEEIEEEIQVLDLRKAYSVPHENNNENNQLQPTPIDVNIEDDAYNVMVDISQLKALQQHNANNINDDVALIKEMLILESAAAVAGGHGTPAPTNGITQADHDSSSSSSDDIEDEERDFFPLDVAHMARLRHSMQSKYGMHSHSLFDEIGPHHMHPIANSNINSKQHSMSVSSKSVKSRRMMHDEFNESVRKRRSRSMPSMEVVNNDSNESLFGGENEEQGDIVSLLSVLVQHGLYSKKNLNSVQQLTHYNAKQ